MDDVDTIELRSDRGEVGVSPPMEIPVQGPGLANVLVFLNGITFGPSDRGEWPDRRSFEMFVETNYQLRERDVLISSSAYVCLAAFAADENLMAAGLNEATVITDTSRVITLHVSGDVQGDIDLLHVGYQINLLLSRAG